MNGRVVRAKYVANVHDLTPNSYQEDELAAFKTVDPQGGNPDQKLTHIPHDGTMG